jgi:biopolymer transport protein ExbB
MIEEILGYWRTGGALMPVLCVICFCIWFQFLRLRGKILAVVNVPRDFEDDLLRNLSTRSIHGNLDHYGGAPDTLSRAVLHVLEAIGGSRKPGEAFDQFQGARLETIKGDTLVLTALTAAAPLLGLLGTVIGMMATFRAVSGGSGDTAVQVSAGISQALITTQCGLFIAIPGLFGLARIHRLIDHAKVRLGQCRTHLVFTLEASARPLGAG